MSAILFALSAAACQALRIEYRPPENPVAVTALPIPAQKNHFAVIPRVQTELSPRPRRRRGNGTDGDDDSDSGSGDGDSSAAEFFRSTKGIAIVGGVGGGILLILVVVLVVVCVKKGYKCKCCRCCKCRRGGANAVADQYGQVILDDNDSIAYGLETI